MLLVEDLTGEDVVVEHRGEGREDRDAGGDVGDDHRVAVGSFFLAHIGFDVDDIVLVEVVVGGVEDVFGGEVEFADGADTVFLADDGDVLTLSVDGEVADHAECLEYGEAFAVDDELTGTGDVAEDADLEVHEFDGDFRVFDVAFLDETGLDERGEVVMGETDDVDFAEDGEDDVAVVVDEVAGHAGVGAGVHDGAGAGGGYLIGFLVKLNSGFGCFAFDIDAEEVVGLNAFGKLARELHSGIALSIVKIGNLFR